MHQGKLDTLKTWKHFHFCFGIKKMFQGYKLFKNKRDQRFLQEKKLYFPTETLYKCVNRSGNGNIHQQW